MVSYEFSVPARLVRDAVYEDLTITETGSLDTNGFRLTVLGTLDARGPIVGRVYRDIQTAQRAALIDYEARRRFHQQRNAVSRAMRAMRRLTAVEPEVVYPPVRVRSRSGMLRLIEAVVQTPVRVRWSWPAETVARANRARNWQ